MENVNGSNLYSIDFNSFPFLSLSCLYVVEGLCRFNFGIISINIDHDCNRPLISSNDAITSHHRGAPHMT